MKIYTLWCDKNYSIIERGKKHIDSNMRMFCKYQHLMLHYNRENTDTPVNAMVLFKALIHSKTFMSGADSTGLVY